MPKAEQTFRMGWDNDTPTFQGFSNSLEWRKLPWKQMEKKVHKLQTRIYRASSRGDQRTVRKLQKTLLRSWSAKCLSVRRVTQDNAGKKTAGVDGVKALSPEARLNLVKQIKLGNKAKPTRRVWIPKPNGEERPLGIPTIHDRALQALAKMALEPEWEARFEINSYGFRPGRGCHDAIEAIFNHIRFKPKFVLDADISKCFDKINHQALLEKIDTFPSLRRQINQWLKAGYMDGKELFPIKEGTPQGGTISPLLANIALHGLEELITKRFPQKWKGKEIIRRIPAVIRYADDFVVLHDDVEVIKECKEAISEWLRIMGLELKPSKTRLSHTLTKVEGNAGFDFLGFSIQQYETGQYRSAKNPQGKSLGFTTQIKPAKEKQKAHQRKVGEVIRNHKSGSQAEIIIELNPIIRGWSNYYSTIYASKTFNKMDFLVWQKLRSWALRACPRTSKYKVMPKYWKRRGDENWRFTAKNGMALAKHIDTKTKNHEKVKGQKSPYDGDYIYWATRRGKHPQISNRLASLLKRQQGKCGHCHLYFQEGDLIEIDHRQPTHQGGKDEYNNLQALHRHCHDTKTRHDQLVQMADARS
jgi:RNA-directed DNA polymerase